MASPRHRPWPTNPRSVFFDDLASRPTLSKAVKSGEIRHLAVGVWTADLESSSEEIVAANLWELIARQCPDAIVVDRTAARGGRLEGGLVTIATDMRTTPLKLPGVVVAVRTRRGHDSDTPWSSGLTGSSPARSVVDNLVVSRGRDGRPGRTLTNVEMQDWLSEKLVAWGPERFDCLRADALSIAVDFGTVDGQVINELFDEVSGRVPLRAGSSSFSRAVLSGTAWDKSRLALFEQAVRNLFRVTGPRLASPATDGELPFFEAYFSNYIEGTVFSVADAREIVETQTPPARRSADGHDILGTYQCVVDPVGRSQTSTDPEALIEILRMRHRTLMVGRPDIGPGQFKIDSNRVGSVSFVAPELVGGTLLQGLKLLDDLPVGLARALYVMFVIAEVHPFTDGNGRAARLMMNAELSSERLCRIVIPTVFRNEYISALRRATIADGDTAALEEVLVHAWRWTAAMPWEDRSATEAQLEATNALVDSPEASERNLRLRLP